MASVLLEADHLRKSFGPRQLLDLDHLSVYDGEKIGLIGENGAGKTTLLRLLPSGFARFYPSAGEGRWRSG